MSRVFDERIIRLVTTYICAVYDGFTNVHPNNTLTINTLEAVLLEDFSCEVKKQNVLFHRLLARIYKMRRDPPSHGQRIRGGKRQKCKLKLIFMRLCGMLLR